MSIASTLSNLWQQTAFNNLEWGNYVMILVACVFLYLAIKKGFEPLLLVPISFGMYLHTLKGLKQPEQKKEVNS